MYRITPGAASDPPSYAFTEIKTFEFSQPVDVQDETSPAGQLWAKTIEVYYSSVGNGMKGVVWGYNVESPQTLKLMVDWGSLEAYQDWVVSTDFTSLMSQWQSGSVLAPFQCDTLLTAFLMHQAGDGNLFTLPAEDYFQDCVHVFLTYHFPASFDPAALNCKFNGPKGYRNIYCWDSMWQELSAMGLQSKGGCITRVSNGGWWVDNNTNDNENQAKAKHFVGLFRYQNLESAHKVFVPDKEDSDTSYTLRRLRDFAGAGAKIEFVKMMGKKTPEGHVASYNPPAELLYHAQDIDLEEWQAHYDRMNNMEH